MNDKEFEELIHRNPNEALRLIVKAFKEKELLKIGNRSYMNAFKYPLTRFDVKDLMPNGGSLQVLKNPDMLQPLSDPGKLFTDKYVIPPDQLVFPWAGRVYRKSWWGQIAGGLIDATTVIQAALDALIPGRTWKEKVVLKGDFSNLSASIDVPSYTALDLRQAKITLANGVNNTILRVNGKTHVDILGGHLHGNSAGNTGALCKGIFISNSSHIRIIEPYITDTASDGIDFDTNSFDIQIINPMIYSVKVNGIYGASSNKITILGGYISENVADVIAIDNSYDLLIQSVRSYSNGSGFVVAGLTTNILDISIVGCHSIEDGNEGIYVGAVAGYEAQNVNIVGNNIYYPTGADPAKGQGIHVERAVGATISGNAIRSPYRHGIQATLSSHVTIKSNTIRNPSEAGSNLYSGIYLSASTYSIVEGNVLHDVRATPYQKYGIEEVGASDYNQLLYNDIYGVVTGGIAKVGANTLVKNKIGYVTENSGTATITAGATSETVAHGLAATPTKVLVTPRADIGDVWVSARDGTNITINCDTAPATDVIVDWYAEV